ncbi:MAG TPA: hypothetical protein DCZ13_04050 [Porticoccaceae bacterium]|nr:hypothetical protein [Porticoccaceae bacterium]
MTSTTSLIPGPVGQLEVVADLPNASGPLAGAGYFAVVSHPHPLYGGTMDNKVVTTLCRIYRELGVPVARFNFRGVGQSAGQHDHARGEVEDLCAVAAWMHAENRGATALLAGFSFGAAVTALACAPTAAGHCVLVAPPVERYAIANDSALACPTIAVLGSEDDLVEPIATQRYLSQLQPPPAVVLIEGATHFFDGKLTALRERLTPALLEALDASRE